MRKPILLMALAAAGCDTPPPAGYAVVESFADRAAAVTCEPVALGADVAFTELRLTSDSTWTVLDAAQRQVVEFDDSLRVTARTSIPGVGPGAAAEPVSVAALGDSAWAIADRGRLRLVLLSRAGTELGGAQLEFVPHSVEATSSGGLLLTALPFGDKPPTLAVRYEAGRITPLPLPRRSYADMMVTALGNTALVETLPDASTLVVHQFLEPRAFRIGPDGAVTALRPPIPEGTAEHVSYVPTAPITDEQMPRMLVPAMAMSVDPATAEVYLLTRSGRDAGGRPERAILRLDDRLEFREGFTLDVRAAGMVYLPRRELAIVVDEEDRFYACSLPRSESRHARAE